MKKILLILLCFTSIFPFAQIRFEKAYFINNAGERTEGLIKNADWRNSPTTIEYKLADNDKIYIGTLKDIQLFEIYGHAKYVRSNVKLDQSSSLTKNLSTQRAPEFVDKEVFLKEIASGDVRLYKYAEPTIIRFYYQVNDGPIEPLIYKPYIFEFNSIAHNNEYKTQLEKILVCPSLSSQRIHKTEYKENSLAELFAAYYECANPDGAKKISTQGKLNFNLHIRPRVNSASLNFENTITYEAENQMGFGFGIEAEFVLPFQKNKWAIIIEPTYQYYKSETTTTNILTGVQPQIVSVDYKSVELPLGIRHYMFLNPRSKVFVNVQAVLDLSLDSSARIGTASYPTRYVLELKSNPNVALGIGYRYDDKYGIEARFFTNRDITKQYPDWLSQYKNVSLIFSYNIF